VVGAVAVWSGLDHLADQQGGDVVVRSLDDLDSLKVTMSRLLRVAVGRPGSER